MDVIKVSAHSRSTAVAGAIAGVMRDFKHAEVQAIGASAVNQAIKAIAIARNYLLLDGIDIVCYPEFVEIDIEGKDRTAVKLMIDASQRRIAGGTGVRSENKRAASALSAC